MKIKEEKLKKSKIRLKIEVEPADLVNYFSATFANLSKDVSVPGFRPGKAPRKLLEEAIGTGRILSESIDQAISNSYYQAIKEKKLVPVGHPNIAIEKHPNFGFEESEINSNLIYIAEIEVMPEIEFLDFSKIKVKEKKIDEIKNDDVGKIVSHLLRQKATFSDVDRTAKIGDRVEINFQGSVGGVKKDQMTSKNHPLVLGDKTMILGFEEEIAGMKKGEEKTFEITFPKDYHSKEVAGKKAKFEVVLVDLKEVILPEADEKFAKNFGHENFNSLEKAIEKSLKEEIEMKHKQELESEVVEKVLPFLKVELPDGLVGDEVSRMLSELEETTKARGISFPNYLKSIKKDLAEIKKDLRPQAEKNIKIGLLLGEIIRSEKLDSNNKDVGRVALDFLIKKVAQK